MGRLGFLGLALSLGVTVAVSAQVGHPTKGSWSGYWGTSDAAKRRILLVLDWRDRQITGVINPGPNQVPIDKAELDVDTLRALEDSLEAFPGCAVVISHDRWFLDRIATHVLAFEGDSQVRWFEGNFSEYEAWRHKELGAAADQPHQIKFKRLAS